MRDLALVMPTVDRSPRQNYLPTTLANLSRSGLWSTERLHSVHLVDSGGPADWPDRVLVGMAYTDRACHETGPLAAVRVHRAPTRRQPAENAAAALCAGAQSGAAWVVFLEDDVDVCADFLGAVGRWLDEHGTDAPMVYKFATDHSALYRPEAVRTGAWVCAVDQTWSTVCMAMRPPIAADLSTWLEANPLFTHRDGRVDTAYDFEMQRWAADRKIDGFVCSSPSFVQHLGDASAIRPSDRRVIRFRSWPGRDWTYQQQQEVTT